MIEKMWINKITNFFDTMSEYDNSSLSLHFAIDLVDMLKERISFALDDSSLVIKVLPYQDETEENEIDEEGFLHWCHFTFHKELVDNIISLKQKFSASQTTLKKLSMQMKQIQDEKKKNELKETIDKLSKEIDTVRTVLSRVDNYRRNVFTQLKDKESVDRILNNIRICREYSE